MQSRKLQKLYNSWFYYAGERWYILVAHGALCDSVYYKEKLIVNTDDFTVFFVSHNIILEIKKQHFSFISFDLKKRKTFKPCCCVESLMTISQYWMNDHAINLCDNMSAVWRTVYSICDCVSSLLVGNCFCWPDVVVPLDTINSCCIFTFFNCRPFSNR